MRNHPMKIEEAVEIILQKIDEYNSKPSTDQDDNKFAEEIIQIMKSTKNERAVLDLINKCITTNNQHGKYLH